MRERFLFFGHLGKQKKWDEGFYDTNNAEKQFTRSQSKLSSPPVPSKVIARQGLDEGILLPIEIWKRGFKQVIKGMGEEIDR